MPVIYDEKKIIPAPLVRISQEVQRNPDGLRIGSLFVLTLTGTIVAYKGSPNSSNVFHEVSGYPADEVRLSGERLGSILRKQEALLKLFANEGKLFEIQTPDGGAGAPISTPMKCNPRVRGIEFTEGIWYDRCDYTITLEVDNLAGLPEESPYIKESNEEWTVEEADFPNTFRVSHDISAVGKLIYDEDGDIVKPAWQQARDYVNLHMESGGLTFSRFNSYNFAGMSGFNYSIQESINPTNGAYRILEAWLVNNSNVTHQNSITVRNNIENTRTEVTINGTIQGLYYGLQNQSQRFANASLGWSGIKPSLVNVAQSGYRRFGGSGTFNSLPTNREYTENPIEGTISYSYTFDDRPAFFFPNALSEMLDVSYSDLSDQIGIIPVPGGAKGPILQGMGTKKAPKSRTVTLQAVFPPTPITANLTQLTDQQIKGPSTDSLFELFVPDAPKVFTDDSGGTWSPSNGTYSRRITWIYEE